jgi:tRNA-dihydrouridine synthase A
MIVDQEFRFSVAPMMEWTDSLCRQFHRVLTRRARLYTEMVAAAAILRGPYRRLLAFEPIEQPLALQIGGAEPSELAAAARIGEESGFCEINLNIGCPSDRVRQGRFGACLMREPRLVGDCIAAMKAAVSIPVTMKCRIGVDEQDAEEALDRLADEAVSAGIDAAIVHARKAWLEGLSPKENREIPPLDYGRVYRLKKRLPSLPVVLNGGIRHLGEAKAHLGDVDGVMLGRAAYQNPAILLRVDPELFGVKAPVEDAVEAVQATRPLMSRLARRGIPVNRLTRHMLGIFSGAPGARAFRRVLATEAGRPGTGAELLDRALGCVTRQEAPIHAAAA